MKRNASRFLMTLPLLTCLSWTAAHADTINFVLTDPTQTVEAGGMLSFYATVSAPAVNAAPVYLNGDSFNVDAPLSVDDTPFFINFPLLLNPGDSTTDILFDISVPLGAPAAAYTGFFAIQGGADGSAQDVLGSNPFTIDVVSGTPLAVSPEPSTWLLLVSGSIGLSACMHKRVGDGKTPQRRR